MKKVVFLDRDGTLIEDKGYICDFSEVVVFPFAVEAIRALNRAGFLVIVASNQSAVARGICTEKQVRRLHGKLQTHFKKQGAAIAAFYYCPFLVDGPVAAYRLDSPLRKPAPGMLLQAARDFDLDLRCGFMVGDKTDDIEAGRKAGCRTVLVRTGYGRDSESQLTPAGPRPDLIADDLLAAVAFITKAPGR
jgi:D-glycero-D-manno-heptose 1,7-bisphosphate phosphatase